jgi:hypothetical protein
MSRSMSWIGVSVLFVAVFTVRTEAHDPVSATLRPNERVQQTRSSEGECAPAGSAAEHAGWRLDGRAADTK